MQRYHAEGGYIRLGLDDSVLRDIGTTGGCHPRVWYPCNLSGSHAGDQPELIPTILAILAQKKLEEEAKAKAAASSLQIEENVSITGSSQRYMIMQKLARNYEKVSQCITLRRCFESGQAHPSPLVLCSPRVSSSYVTWWGRRRWTLSWLVR